MKACETSSLAKPLDNNRSIPLVTTYAAPNAVDPSARTDDDIPVIVREGVWEASLFCCLGANFGALLNSFMGWCLPCVTLAQVSHRIGLANYWVVLLVTLMLTLGEYLIFHFVEWEGRTTSFMWAIVDPIINFVYTATTNEELHVESLYLQNPQTGIFFGCGMWAFVGIVPGLLLVILAWVLRGRVRSRYAIPGSRILDFLAACLCSCCTVAQLASHVKIHRSFGCNFGPADTLPAFPLESSRV